MKTSRAVFFLLWGTEMGLKLKLSPAPKRRPSPHILCLSFKPITSDNVYSFLIIPVLNYCPLPLLLFVMPELNLNSLGQGKYLYL